MEQGTANFCCDQSHGKSSVLHSHTIPLDYLTNKTDGSCFLPLLLQRLKNRGLSFLLRKLTISGKFTVKLRKL